MKIPSLLSPILPFAALTLFFSTLPLRAQSFAQMAEKLDTDGEFVAYLDVSKDASTLGRHLNDIYAAYLELDPEAMPIPLDFIALFNQIGLDGLGSIGYSSLNLGDDLFRNRGIVMLDGEPRGLLRLYDLSPRSFRAAEIAPADATIALDLSVEFGALRDSVTEIATSIMGPMGTGMIQGGLQQPLTPSGLTGNDVLGYLSNPITLIARQDHQMVDGPSGDVYAEIAGAGPLLDHLIGFSESNPAITVNEIESETVVDLSGLLQDSGITLFAKKSKGSDAFLLYTSPAFLAKIGTGRSLAETPEFQEVARHLPKQAAAFSYQRSPISKAIFDGVRDDPSMAKYLPVIEIAFDRLFDDFFAPQASAYFAIDGGIASETYSHFSTRELIAALPVIVAGGIGAAAAIPAFKNVQVASQEKAVTNNLRQFASAAQQYMLEESATAATHDDIVGPGKYIESLDSVAGEHYEDLIVTSEDTVISVELDDGRIVSYEF